jgi:hypothetical protein
MVPSKVHLVGSVALDSVEEVFRTGTVLGHRLRRVLDGEPGGRRILDQLAVSAASFAALSQCRCEPA